MLDKSYSIAYNSYVINKKEVVRTSEQEKAIAEAVAEAISKLPPMEQKYLKGYAEGVAAASRKEE